MSTDTLHVALVLGGHPIDVPATLEAFDSMDGIRAYPQDLPSFVANDGDACERYDAAVFYNYHGHGYCVDLTEEFARKARETVCEITAGGLGIVALHHGVLAFPEMDEWTAVCGLPGDSNSDYHFDQRVRVDLASPDHPITAGLPSFEYVDETYEMDEPDADSTLLLTTDHERSADAIAWTRQYRDSRVFCYQSGHGRSALEHGQVRTVLARGIRWAAGADGDAVTGT
ncbi:ThuA domain-containing protein [Natronobiforma cellulositropha]|uniref:ThuA domain-containing protein n=1 Tax=Natronobiforma cellulositropha TaxID=1679076 RepID=UPI0021D59079|nr:ThuA domain-containing protein [Natronobiforma cellulositropha]